MGGILQVHFKKIRSRDAEGLASDFSRELVSIVHIDGKIKTLAYAQTLRLVQQLAEEIFSCDPRGRKILVNRSTPDYGVLSVHCRAIASFLNYTCIVKDGKIAYVTLYIFGAKHSFPRIEDTKMQKDREVKRVFHKHFLAMFTMSPKVITKDYEDSAVVITNMTEGVCDGKDAITAFCRNLMRSSGKIMRQIRLNGFPLIHWKTKSLPDGVLLLVCEVKALGMVMTETYYVKEGKIQFESSICAGRILKMIREILG